MKPQWLGLTEYLPALQMQEKILADAASAAEFLESTYFETILGLEHPTTITLGKRADPLKDIQVSIRTLKEKQVAIVGVERGGQATLHNPGQLVIYPIINLRGRGIRVRDYVHLLEDVTKRFLADYGIVACCRGDEPGLYTIKGKIAFFGVRVVRGVTSHGLAINVYNNLEEFAWIRSCGKATESFAKMADFGVTAALPELFAAWCTYFQTGLGLTQDANRPMLERPFELRT
jgi:lipoate-protein ligase B